MLVLVMRWKRTRLACKGAFCGCLILPFEQLRDYPITEFQLLKGIYHSCGYSISSFNLLRVIIQSNRAASVIQWFPQSTAGFY
ncbi:hypothetical protein [Metabacillus dongyingensis]|uniref:hypothetical protein n=1 Tax=Metabacillus dongyingensis TaxID=2874282 RepID=UPI001CBAA1AA|nr:hypothetical protein [Metabacillus dongyingensis]UAL52024.1 hypothetical protein K8L98_23160 [Metabacillus dongyingensis]